MKNKFILILLFLISIHLFSQENKFSIEINYPIPLSNGIEKFSGIIDGNIKYRFKKSEMFNFGTSYTFDYLKANYPFGNEDLSRNYFFHHINLFAELEIPSVEKIHPFVSIGYSYLSYDYEYLQGGEFFTTVETKKNKNSGLNLKLGVQYDFNKWFFMQTYFHYIRAFNKNEYTNETVGVNYNQLKFGLGIRF